MLTAHPLPTTAGDLFTPLLARGTGRLPWVVPEEARPVKPAKAAPKPEPVVQVVAAPAPVAAPAATPVPKPPLFKRLGELPGLGRTYTAPPLQQTGKLQHALVACALV